MKMDVFDSYYSKHYSRFMPKTALEWDYVVNRLELNFGEFFDLIPRDSRILDIPCGVGYLECYLLNHGFSAIHAVDISEEQIEVAKQKLLKINTNFGDMIQFNTSDAFDFLKANGNYTAIALIDFLEHLKKDKIVDMLNLSFNALSHNGFLFARVINADNPMWGQFFYHDFTHETPFTPDSIRQCFGLTGFKIVKLGYEVLPPPIEQPGFAKWVRRIFPWRWLWLRGKILGISPQVFTEDLVVVARKP